MTPNNLTFNPGKSNFFLDPGFGPYEFSNARLCQKKKENVIMILTFFSHYFPLSFLVLLTTQLLLLLLAVYIVAV